MLEKVSWPKRISRKERKDAKILKNIKSIKRLIILFPEKRDTLKLFAYFAWDLLHQLLCNLLIRRNYARKSLLDKKILAKSAKTQSY